MIRGQVVFRNIKLPYDKDEGYALECAHHKAEKLGVTAKLEDARIHKKSVDARRKGGKPSFVYSIAFAVEQSPDRELLEKYDAVYIAREDINPIFGNETLGARPIVVGFGPCGMYAAMLLAENGYRPIVIERGSDADNRRAAVKRFYKTGVLENSNIQFGAGGAGTFSDGKLVTRINDPRCSYVLETMVELGAPDEVLYSAKPHVGTDKLLGVVRNAAHRIKELGGEIKYNVKLTDVTVQNGKVTRIKTDDGEEYEVSVLILAIGHSARDTYEMLFENGVAMEAKPFSVGVRVEHFQTRVDESLYGKLAGDPRLPKGEYALSHREGGRAVYTFCMCPGGEVVAAASEAGGVVTNGMSSFARDGKNANAAVAVSVSPEDYGASPLDGIEFQRRLERGAFELGGGGYKAPCETVGDFIEGKAEKLRTPKIIRPTYMNGNVRVARLDTIFPTYVNSMLRRGFEVFGNKMRCFRDPAAPLTGVETRTSAPVRIMRGEKYTALGIDNLYPGGEGAGYAGGITSAAVDGINIAMAVMERYKAE